MNIPIIGLVENMSYFRCPDNGKDYKIFGESHIEEIAALHNIEVLAQLPIEPKFSAMCDKGLVELFEGDWLEKAADKLETIKEKTKEKEMIKIAVASEENMVSGHFGHCGSFNIYTVEGGKITGSESVATEGQGHSSLGAFLSERGVTVVLTGGIGTGAVNMLAESGIEVVSGVSGEAKTAAEAYLQGKLTSAGSNCQGHEHADGEGCGASCGGGCH